MILACDLLGKGSIQEQTRSSHEDAVVRDQRYSEVHCRRSDPAVCIVLSAAEGMAESLSGDPQLDVGQEQGRARPYDLRPTEVGLQT